MKRSICLEKKILKSLNGILDDIQIRYQHDSDYTYKDKRTDLLKVRFALQVALSQVNFEIDNM